MKFPENFLWGDAVTVYQCEGGWNEGEEGIGVPDIITNGSHTVPRRVDSSLDPEPSYPAYEAIDFYHHCEEDVALFAEMGFRVFRLSINQTRILPTGKEGEANEKGLVYHDKVFDCCRRHHIEPLVTISHYELPYVLVEEYNGWVDHRPIDFYVSHCKVIFEHYKDKVKCWLTFNEINCGTLSTGTTIAVSIIQGYTGLSLEAPVTVQTYYQVLHHQFVASTHAMNYAHENYPQSKMGNMIAFLLDYSYACNSDDVLVVQGHTRMVSWFCSDVQIRGSYPSYSRRFFIEDDVEIQMEPGDLEKLKKETADSYTSSYCITSCVSADPSVKCAVGNLSGGAKNPYLNASDWGWQIDPKGLRWTLNEIYDRYQIPLIVVENGLGAYSVKTEDGKVHSEYRIGYLRQHIGQIGETTVSGVDLTGCIPQGRIDLVSLSIGEIAKRYGFTYVNKFGDGTSDLSRKHKDSFYWYQKVVATNGSGLS